ncbi:unnamed protein product [Adineta ricciae]|uniref:Uncharacterized protein n=1 Tax=Adineta ricciae TaxID=249248 RepID=A0A813RSQ4_ADIRI|nr:unnamed protein product [Adineta ricciae]
MHYYDIDFDKTDCLGFLSDQSDWFCHRFRRSETDPEKEIHIDRKCVDFPFLRSFTTREKIIHQIKRNIIALRQKHFLLEKRCSSITNFNESKKCHEIIVIYNVHCLTDENITYD